MRGKSHTRFLIHNGHDDRAERGLAVTMGDFTAIKAASMAETPMEKPVAGTGSSESARRVRHSAAAAHRAERTVSHCSFGTGKVSSTS